MLKELLLEKFKNPLETFQITLRKVLKITSKLDIYCLFQELMQRFSEACKMLDRCCHQVTSARNYLQFTLSNHIHPFFSFHNIQSHSPFLLHTHYPITFILLLSHCPITCALSSPVTLSNHMCPLFSSHIVQSHVPSLLLSHCPITFTVSSPLTLSNHIHPFISSHIVQSH